MCYQRDPIQNKLERTLYVVGSSLLDALQAVGATIVRIAFFGIALNLFWGFVKDIPGLHTITDRQIMELFYLNAVSIMLGSTFHRLMAYAAHHSSASEKQT